MRLRCILAGLLFLATAIAVGQVNGHTVSSAAGVTSATLAGPVKNSPFSSDEVTQYDRALDNGGHIHRETRGKIFRDSQGRMRTESESPSSQPGAEKFEHVTINDPVQQVIINLSPKLKTGTIFHFTQGVGPTAVGMGNLNGAPVNTAPRSTTIEPKPASGAMTTSRMSGTLGTSPSPVQSHTEALGSKYIEGVNATGTRTTRIIDAGSQGNDKPIVSVTETWFSPELKMTLLSETDDGQGGHGSMKLENITRTEPAAQLFQVPSDYTMKDTQPATASMKH